MPDVMKELGSMRRKVLSLAASLTLLLPAVLSPASAVAAKPQAATAAAASPAPAGEFAAIALDAPNPQVPGGYEPVAETASARLYVNRADSKLIVEDKRYGKLWTSNPLEALSDQKTILDDAVFQLNYTNARRQMTNLASSASEKPDLTFQSVQDGVRAVYDIPKLKLNITVDYTLKEEPRQDVPGQTLAYLQVTVPDGGVKEGGDCSSPTSTTCFMVVTLEMLPLFGAATVGSDGYLMIPDESGAIVRFKPEYPQYRQRYSAAIYGADAAGQAFSGTAAGGSTFRSDRPRMPIWGLKDGESAYAGIVTKGQYQTNINGYLAGYITNANRASAEFIYRRQASIPRRRTLFVNRIEDDQIPGERQVRYVLLGGDDANYAGMAKAYRDYLIKSRGLKKLADTPPRPLIDVYMGALRRSAFQDDFIPMTTFAQSQAMIQSFIDRGIKDFDVQLIGWNDGGERGYWPRRYPAEDELGGNDGLRALTDFAHKHGVKVYLQDNYVYGYTISSGGIFGQIPFVRNIWPNWSYGFNTRFDTMRGVNKLPVFQGTGTGPRGIGFYLINPVIATNNYVDRDFPTHKSMGADGVLFSIMGTIVASDTNEFYPLSRDQVAETWMKMADKSRQMLGGAMVAGSNDYVLGRTDRIYDAPVDSIDAFGDVAVPVYHIATQGLAVRTTYAVNLRNDPRTEVLRQIEWGMQPVYQLTNQPTADLIRTGFQRLYSGDIDEWLDPAVAEYTKMRDEFGYLGGKYMTNHEILANRVNRVTYEDGSRLTVNYNPEPYVGADGTTVDAYSYVLRKPGA
jgi:hypothetical protein